MDILPRLRSVGQLKTMTRIGGVVPMRGGERPPEAALLDSLARRTDCLEFFKVDETIDAGQRPQPHATAASRVRPGSE
jgi:hypothetical protein